MIGLRINNYVILSLLGEGGMGSVYLAEHPVMGRRAAIKFLRRELTEDKSLVSRFINEARAATAIRHPNIIDVIDVGTLPDQGQQPYMMMEYLEGESLARRLQRLGRLPIDSAVDIALQTASALGAAHAKGIVHRDLKPDNLFLVPDDRDPDREQVKVLDFGIAKLRGELSGGTVKTNAGAIMGTPPYMSPEQCRGINDEIDHRTDVYALGVILYQMLTGAPPFMSSGFGEVLVMHLTREPAPLRPQNPEVTEALEATVMRALAKTVDQRFGSMAELRSSLRPALATPSPLLGAGTLSGVGNGGGTMHTPAGPTLRAPIKLPTPPVGMPRPSDTTLPSSLRASTTFSTAASQIEMKELERPRRRALVPAAIGGGLVAVALAAFLGLGRSPAPSAPSAPSDRPAAAAGPAANPPAAPAAPAAELPPAPAAPPVAAPPPAPEPAVAPPPEPAAEPEPAARASDARHRPARMDKRTRRDTARTALPASAPPAQPRPVAPPPAQPRPAVAAPPAPAPSSPPPAPPPPSRLKADKW